MNKNWLYRILAIALVALLALPVFAMAEEVEAFELGAVELEEKKLTYDPVDPDPWDPTVPFDFDGPSVTYNTTIDLGNLTWDDTHFLYENAMSTFKKTNSNSKVVTVSQRGTISLTGKTGKSTITFTAKGAHTETKSTCTIKLNIINTAKIKVHDFPGSKAAYIQPDPQPTYDFWYVDDGEDTVPENADSYYLTFKSSNKNAVAVDFETGELTIKKPGKATITIREYWEAAEGERPLLVCTLKKTIEVKKNQYKDTKADEEACLKAAKADEDLYIGVRSAEFTKVDTEAGTGDLKVVFFVANGTANTINKIWGLSEATVIGKKYATARDKRLNTENFEEILPEGGGEVVAEGKSKTVSWKKNGKKIGTLEVTFKDAPLADLTGDLTQVECTSFSYKLTKKDLVPTEITIKEF